MRPNAPKLTLVTINYLVRFFECCHIFIIFFLTRVYRFYLLMLFDEHHKFIALIRIPGASLARLLRLMIFIATIPTPARFCACFYFFRCCHATRTNSHEIEHFGRAQTVIVVCRSLNALELLAAYHKATRGA